MTAKKTAKQRAKGESAAEPQRLFVVDRVEGDVAVLVDDADGRAYDVPVSVLAVPPREGAVLRVPDGPDGAPDWAGAVADEAERERRMRELGTRAARLAAADPGGDVAL